MSEPRPDFVPPPPLENMYSQAVNEANKSNQQTSILFLISSIVFPLISMAIGFAIGKSL